MKVYLVIWQDWDDYEVEGVFATEAGAQAYIDGSNPITRVRLFIEEKEVQP